MTDTNADQRAAWDGESGTRWAADADRRDRVLSPIGDLLIRESGIVSGEEVLDLGCGCGTTTLAAAVPAGPGGRVHGVDLSGPMLAVARERASAHQAVTVDFAQADIQVDTLQGPHDVAISRFGTMFFDDPIAAFTNVRRHLHPGGRLCIATWQPLTDNEWLTVPGAALLAYADLPDAASTTGPGMFAQSDPDQVASVLDAAGWKHITSTPHRTRITVGADLDDAVDYLANSGPGRTMLESVRPEQVDEALAAVRSALLPHLSANGVALSASVLVTTATTL